MGKLHYLVTIITFGKYLSESKKKLSEESAKDSTAECTCVIFSRILHKWNNTKCNLLQLAFFRLAWCLWDTSTLLHMSVDIFYFLLLSNIPGSAFTMYSSILLYSYTLGPSHHHLLCGWLQETSNWSLLHLLTVHNLLSIQ